MARMVILDGVCVNSLTHPDAKGHCTAGWVEEILPLLQAKSARFFREFPVSPSKQSPILHRTKDWYRPCSSSDRTMVALNHVGRNHAQYNR